MEENENIYLFRLTVVSLFRRIALERTDTYHFANTLSLHAIFI